MRLHLLLLLPLTCALAAAAATSPTEDVELSAAMGGVTFRLSCASCHGQAAKGDGPVAQYLKVQPADLTQIAVDNDGVFPAERVRASIDGREPVRGHGSPEMPIWGDVFGDINGEAGAKVKIDELVAFLASIQAE